VDKKNFLVGFVGFLLFFALSIFSFQRETRALYLYYSAECPHCLKVVDFTLKTKLKRPVILKEVFYNDANYEEFKSVAKRVGLDTLKVPALFDLRRNKLLTGEEKVMNYLRRYVEE